MSVEAHKAEVVAAIRAAVAAGATEFHDVLSRCEGADPRLVDQCVQELDVRFPSQPQPARSSSGGAVPYLPAPDPGLSQWWFSGEAVEIICDRLNTSTRGSVLCLGAPTIGYRLLRSGVDAIVLDLDEHVVSMLREVFGERCADVYDAADGLPTEHQGRYSAVVLDPPWYEAAAMTFMRRALDALEVGGELLMSLPPRLTRPGAETFRATLIRLALSPGNELLALERGSLRYMVPRFEEVALASISGFRGLPWRHADLLHVRKKAVAGIESVSQLERRTAEVFARSPREFRVFVSEIASAHESIIIEPLQEYSRNISTRAHAAEMPDLWTTEKIGARIGNRDLVIAILTVWSDLNVKTRDDAIEQLRLHYKHPAVVENAVLQLDSVLHLWSRFATQPPLRTDEEIAQAKQRVLTEWAAKASPREYHHDADKFRAEYQRDRDRILWSGALRRLGHKTQLFPAEHDDQTRQRLTHSIEVMQLASTIGASFGLDRDLIEAGALSHDIGHTPFGHAGEHALDALLQRLDSSLSFNHYEHGVDVVRWLEGPYYVSENGPLHGLNLTKEVAECILKHTFCHSGDDPASTEQILARGKHADFIPRGYCHLEGQAVRIADKISYFVSDLEDGLRLGAISRQDLLSCHFFHRSPLYFGANSRASIYESFVAQRRTILKLLMEDVLVATSKRLTGASPERVRDAGEYLVNHSAEIQADLDEVWKKLQVGRLHKDRRVQAANLRAARIVSELTLLFAVSPELIDEEFRSEYNRLFSSKYMQFYARAAGKKVDVSMDLIAFLPLDKLIGFKMGRRDNVVVSVEQVIQAKDFVAGLTDSRATRLHAELLG